MEFWGVEVKAGQPLKVKPTFDNIIHLSQASLGEPKKEKVQESVPLYVKFGDKKLVLGTLISENIPQLSFDLVFEKEFELSHNWKNGSVYFCGYQTPLPQDSSDEFDMEDSDEEEEEELPAIPAVENGKAATPKAEKANAATTKVEKANAATTKVEKANAAIPKANAATPKANAATPKANAAKPAKPIKDVKPEEDDDDDESDDEDDSDDEMVDGDDSDEISGEDDGSDDDDEDDSEDDSEEEETPKKVEAGKKRPAESAPKTPVTNKKAKTPLTDGKKGGHVATPYPSKGAKTPNAKPQTPKSGGQQTCSSCSKTFNSDNALQSHTKAKHSGK